MSRWKILSRGEIEDTHYASLEVLETVGMVVQEETSLKLLEEAGANVDPKRKLVKIPQHLIHETLKKIPKGGEKPLWEKLQIRCKNWRTHVFQSR